MNDTRKNCISQQKPERPPDSLGISQSSGLDKHAVMKPYQETVGALCRGDEKGIGNQYVSQDKCIIAGEITEEYSATNLVRRLTPLECERLQGYPDGWTDVPGASDSARYKALGNSVAIPCVEYLMQRVAMVITLDLEWDF